MKAEIAWEVDVEQDIHAVETICVVNESFPQLCALTELKQLADV